MDLPFDDWADLSAAGMGMLAVHLPSGALAVAILDATATLPDGQGTEAHAEALATLGYQRMPSSACNGWYRTVDFWKPGVLHRPSEPEASSLVAALGGTRVRFSRKGHFVDRSHMGEVVTQQAIPPANQPVRDLYLRTLTRLSRRIKELKDAGAVPSESDRTTMADWPETVFETVGEVPGNELDALALLVDPGRPGEGSLAWVADAVWRMLTVEDLEDAVQASYAGDENTLAYLSAYMPAEMPDGPDIAPGMPH